MRKINKSEIVFDEWIKSVMSKRWTGGYRYFSSLALTEDDFEIYNDWFEKCESLGFEYALGYIETEKRYKIVWGFSMFEFLTLRNGVAVSHDFDVENEEKIITEMAFDKFNKSSYFMFPDTISKCNATKSDSEWNEILDTINDY